MLISWAQHNEMNLLWSSVWSPQDHHNHWMNILSFSFHIHSELNNFHCDLLNEEMAMRAAGIQSPPSCSANEQFHFLWTSTMNSKEPGGTEEAHWVNIRRLNCWRDGHCNDCYDPSLRANVKQQQPKNIFDLFSFTCFTNHHLPDHASTEKSSSTIHKTWGPEDVNHECDTAMTANDPH